MTRRLLGLCLLAYPRDRRERDRDFLHDLALELGATQGLARQALSLLLGGLRQRIADHRRRASRAAVACLALVALTLAASALTGIGNDHEVEEEHACAYARQC